MHVVLTRPSCSLKKSSRQSRTIRLRTSFSPGRTMPKGCTRRPLRNTAGRTFCWKKRPPKQCNAKPPISRNRLKGAGPGAIGKSGSNSVRRSITKAAGSAYYIAVSHARLGDRDRAFEQLEKPFNDHEADLNWIKNEPAFDTLSSDPRFTDLLRRIGLPNKLLKIIAAQNKRCTAGVGT